MAKNFNIPFHDYSFPGCLEIIDVDDFEDVNPMTMKEASKLYWNARKVETSARATSGFLASGFQVSVEDEGDPFDLENSQGNPAQPNQRGCEGDWVYYRDSDFKQPDGTGGNYAEFSIDCDLEIVQLHRDGVRIGFGVRAEAIVARAYSNAADIDAAIAYKSLVSYGDFTTAGWGVDLADEEAGVIPPENYTEKAKYILIDDIPFIELIVSGSTVTGNDPAVDIVTAQTGIFDFSFHTYPPRP